MSVGVVKLDACEGVGVGWPSDRRFGVNGSVRVNGSAAVGRTCTTAGPAGIRGKRRLDKGNFRRSYRACCEIAGVGALDG